MTFKEARIAGEFLQLPEKCPALLPVIVYADWVVRKATGSDAVVTGIFRTAAEQIALIARGQAAQGATSVHQVWRGFDLRSSGLTDAQLDDICRRVNAAFRYGASSAGKILPVMAVHTQGTARHLHGQIPAGARWQITGVSA
jgi:hypothetical protein